MADPNNNPLGELLRAATAIKEADPEVQARRKRWEGYPEYVRGTLLGESILTDTLERMRDPSRTELSERLAYANAARTKGNDSWCELLQSDSKGLSADKQSTLLFEAEARYIEALGVFRYLVKVPPVPPSKDEDVKFIDTVKELEEDENGVPDDVLVTLVSTYNNLAVCYLRCRRFQSAVQACEEVIGLDPSNGKGWYRLATALYSLDEIPRAIETMNHALIHIPKDEDGLRLRSLLIARQRKWQKEAADIASRERKQYGGMFDRGSIHVDGTAAAAAAGATARPGVSSSNSPKSEKAEAKFEFMQRYLRNGSRIRAINQAKQAGKKPGVETAAAAAAAACEFKEASLMEMAELEMSARKHGLDLSDPVIQKELEELQAAHEIEANSGKLDLEKLKVPQRRGKCATVIVWIIGAMAFIMFLRGFMQLWHVIFLGGGSSSSTSSTNE
jgi:tetratricopeptide (TPR) repeat protein